MPVSPICLVQDGSGPFNTTDGGVNVTVLDTISIKLNDTTGVAEWFLQIYGTDELANTGAITLANVNPSTNLVTTPASIVSFTFPASTGAAGNTLVFISTVMGSGGPVSTNFGIFTLTTNNLRVGAVGQTREGDSTFGWAAITNPAIRNSGSVGLPTDLAITGQQRGDLLYFNGTHWVRFPPGTSGFVLTSAGAATLPAYEVIPLPTDLNISGEAQGDILYFNGTHWVRLPAGTSGQFLETLGAAANPAWTTIPNGIPFPGGVPVEGDLLVFHSGVWSRLDAGTTGFVLTSAGTSTLPAYEAIPLPTDLNISGETQGDLLYFDGTHWVRLPAGGTSGFVLTSAGASTLPVYEAIPLPTDLNISGEAQGDILYFNGTHWVRLPAGTSGQFLETLGAAANPIWANTSFTVFNTQTVTGPATITANSGSLVLADASGGSPTIHPPSTSTIGTFFGVTDTHNSAATNNISVGNVSLHVEDPGNPGSYSASVTLATNSQTVWWVYSQVTGGINAWKVWATSNTITTNISAISFGVYGNGADGNATCNGTNVVSGMTLVKGTTATVASVNAGGATITGLANITFDDVGKTLTLSGAAVAGNNGTFPIEQILSDSSVVIVNAGANSSDANNGSIIWKVPNYYLQTRDVTFASLTINSGVVLNANGFRILAQSLIVNGHIQVDGGFGAPDSTVILGGGGQGTSTLIGGSPAFGGSSTTAPVSPGLGGVGGVGGVSGSIPGTVTSPNDLGLAAVNTLPTALTMLTYGNVMSTGISLQAVGGGSGGTEGGGGGGPSGGSGAGVVVIIANTLSGNGSITANGGTGGTSSGGGAGGGGGGGVIVLVTRINLFTGSVQVNGGAAGDNTAGGGDQTAQPGGVGTIITLQS